MHIEAEQCVTLRKKAFVNAVPTAWSLTCLLLLLLLIHQLSVMPCTLACTCVKSMKEMTVWLFPCMFLFVAN